MQQFIPKINSLYLPMDMLLQRRRFEAAKLNILSNSFEENFTIMSCTLPCVVLVDSEPVHGLEFLILSGTIPVVYVLIGIREIRQTQLNKCYYMLLHSFIKVTCFDPHKGLSSGRG
jgi:hypothetical protein